MATLEIGLALGSSELLYSDSHWKMEDGNPGYRKAPRSHSL